MAYYEEEFLVTCCICNARLRVINGLHLRKHELTVEEYRTLHPNAPLSKIRCEDCGRMMTDSVSLRRQYCEPCIVLRREHQDRERKRKQSRRYRASLSPEDQAILNDHHYPGLGTSGPTTWLDEIEVENEKRIIGAVYLEQERRKNGFRTYHLRKGTI